MSTEVLDETDLFTQDSAVPAEGQLVTVRNRNWVVTSVKRSSIAVEQPGSPLLAEAQHLVSLVSVDDDAGNQELRVLWELEAGASAREQHALPSPACGFDEPAKLDAFLDAVRWGSVATADKTLLQAPFRSGVKPEDYQLDPVVRALQMPRTNLLIADDVGLGKTIEAGLVMQELMLRHRARTMLIVCPASLTLQWRDEMRDKFGLAFKIVDAELLRDLRRSRGLDANPWTHYPRLIVSIDWLKRERPLALLRSVLPSVPQYPRAFGHREVRRRLAAYDRYQSPCPAHRAPAVPLGDPAQRLPGVLHRAAGPVGQPPVRPHTGAVGGGEGSGDGAAVEAGSAAEVGRYPALPGTRPGPSPRGHLRRRHPRRLREARPIRTVAPGDPLQPGDTGGDRAEPGRGLCRHAAQAPLPVQSEGVRQYRGGPSEDDDRTGAAG